MSPANGNFCHLHTSLRITGSRGNHHKVWDPPAGHEETSRGCFPGQGALLHKGQGGGVEERSPHSDSYRDLDPTPRLARPPASSSTPPRPPPPRPARPGPALTHLQAQGRPAGAQELADVAQALALVPRLRVDLQHTASLSGLDASSAPFLGLHQSPPPARTRKCARDRK